MAKIEEERRLMPTYMYGDPDPVAKPGRIYPYFRYDGFTNRSVDRELNFIKLENDWVTVWVTPSIGGKIWGAQEKESGEYFIYFNNAVKFRDIALRGAWTSGGIEINFGTIGHAPTCATPVDYYTRENMDGSVSCFLGAIDLTSRTEWRVEVLLPADKAWFETISSWFNLSDEGTSLYHWMNASADTGSDLRYFFPGSSYLDHSGIQFSWPETDDGRDISLYRNNDYGSNHSYHIAGNYSDWFAGYYRKKDFGFGHWSRNSGKVGRKIWIWSLAREGAIWENLLADTLLGNRQYTEIQTGLLFNQANSQSKFSPFKHVEFQAGSEHHFSEIWFPVKSTGGVSSANPDAVINNVILGDSVRITINALSKLADTMDVMTGGVLRSVPVLLEPMEVYNQTFAYSDGWTAEMRNSHLKTGDVKPGRQLKRPLATGSFVWESSFGLYTLGVDQLNQRDYKGAYYWLSRCLEKDPSFMPAYTALSKVFIHNLEYNKAGEALLKVLSFNTYDPEANYLFGLLNDRLDNNDEARIAYGIALLDQETKVRAATRLVKLSLRELDLVETADLFKQFDADIKSKSLERSRLVYYRLTGNDSIALALSDVLLQADPLDHFARFETWILTGKETDKLAFKSNITNELQYQTYIELATWYMDAGLFAEAEKLLGLSPPNPLVDYYSAYVWSRLSDDAKADRYLADAINKDFRFIFPFRHETERILLWANERKPDWKTDYLLALLYWSSGRGRDASGYFSSIGNKPADDYIYMARGDFYLESDSLEAEKNYREALNINNNSWRVYLRLIDFYHSAGFYSRALELSSEAFEKFTGNYIIGLAHAKSLLARDLFYETIDVLKELELLPFEGASEGRKIWREANIFALLDKSWKGELEAAREYADNAYMWPENLGAGKPFNSKDVLVDFLNAGLLIKESKAESADSLYNQIAGMKLARGVGESPNILKIFSLRELNKTVEADSIFKKWIGNTADEHLRSWARALYNGEYDSATRIAEKIPDQPYTEPWEQAITYDDLNLLNRVVLQYLREKW